MCSLCPRICVRLVLYLGPGIQSGRGSRWSSLPGPQDAVEWNFLGTKGVLAATEKRGKEKLNWLIGSVLKTY